MNAKGLRLAVIGCVVTGLLISSCAASAIVTPIATSAPPTETVMPTKTAVPTIAPTDTPAAGAVLTDWKEIPIMPGAISGEEDTENGIYQFTIQATIPVIASYYLHELTASGWVPQDAQDPQDFGHGHFSFTRESKAVVFEIFPDEQNSISTVWIFIAQM